MKTFFGSLKPALIALALLTVILGILYPLFIYGIGELFFHKKTNGTLFYDKVGKIVGSEWIGQNFTKPEYFHPRPSAAGDKGYDATSSSGSNLGPTSQKLVDTLKKRAADYRSENKLPPDAVIPADAVTASGSGLDPHISVSNALLQAARIAAARHLNTDQVKTLIEEFTEAPTWGLFGESRINVLRINLRLDEISPSKKSL